MYTNCTDNVVISDSDDTDCMLNDGNKTVNS